MARHWAPLRDPKVAETRSRNIVNPVVGSASSLLGQRPLFSEPGPDQPPPDEGRMGPEVRPDNIHPSDERAGSNATEDLTKAEAIQLVPFHVIDYNVTNPPTDAEIKAAAGSSALLGDAFIIRDGTGLATLWFIVKGGLNTYHYVKLTRAL